MSSSSFTWEGWEGRREGGEGRREGGREGGREGEETATYLPAIIIHS